MSFCIGKLSRVAQCGMSSVFRPQRMYVVNLVLNFQSKPYGIRTMFVESFKYKNINACAVKDNCL